MEDFSLLSHTRVQPRKSCNAEHAPAILESLDRLIERHPLPEQSVKKVITVVERIIEAGQIFGLGPRPTTMEAFLTSRATCSRVDAHNMRRIMKCFKSNVHKYLDFCVRNGEDSWVPLFKWKFAAYFSYHRTQEIPPCPFSAYNRWSRKMLNPQFLLGGIFHDWLGMLRSFEPDDFYTFVDTVLQLKKVMPRVSDALIDLTIAKTVDTLCSERPEAVATQDEIDAINFHIMDDEDFLTQFDFSREAIEEQIDRTVRELFEDSRLSYEGWIEPFFPSTSANYINSRSQGGAVGEILQCSDFADTFDMGSGLEIGVQLESLNSPISWHYGELGKHEDLKFKIDADLLGQPVSAEIPTLKVDDRNLRRRWEETYWRIWDKSKDEIPFVAPVGLAEPLKVRVISKGPPYLYTALKPMQRFLFRRLRQIPQFSLIGRYVVPDDIEWVASALQADESLLSGDYKASTDNLRSWVSNRIIDKLMDKLGENASDEDLAQFPSGFFNSLRSFMKTALTGHYFNWDGKVRAQVEGQLMGSIVSFPILCVANAVLCRMAMELSCVAGGVGSRENAHCMYYYTQPWRACPVLLNGDDCLLRGNFHLKRIWELLGKVFGLESSVGKTYWSRRFCTINSTIFEFCEGPPSQQVDREGIPKKTLGYWKERKYVNLGLLHGLKRSAAKGTEPKQSAGNLGCICRELKRSCPERVWPQVKGLFIRHNRDKLNLFSKVGLPWFLPEWLGGAGLPRDDESLSYVDLQAASFVRELFAHKIAVEKPVVQWKMHELVMKRLRNIGVERTNFKFTSTGASLEESWSKLYGLLTIDLLFTCPYTELVEDPRTTPLWLKTNSRLWREARKLIGKQTVNVMSEEELAYEKRDFVIPAILENVTYGLHDDYECEGTIYAQEKFNGRGRCPPSMDYPD